MKWVKPNGNTIETNDLRLTIQACEKKGWKREEDQPERKKPGRPKKTQD